MQALIALFTSFLAISSPKDCIKVFPEVDKIFFQAEAQLGIPKGIFWEIVWTESRCKPFEVGASGEIGLGQIIPSDDTRYPSSWFNDRPLAKDLLNPQTNARWTVNILYGYLKTCKKELACALAMYNEGTKPGKKGYTYAWQIINNTTNTFYR